MKERLVLFVFLVVLLAVPASSGSLVDWLMGVDWVTGRVTEAEPVAVVSEQVKCVFLGSNSEQKCYAGDGTFSCSGVGSCVVDVSGVQGAKFEWKSGCGSYGYTVIDGNSKDVLFKCEVAPACGNGACESGEACSSCPADCGQCATPAPSQEVKEQVNCVFVNSGAVQKCYTADGRFSCSAAGSCLADVYGTAGMLLPWKSSCEGYVSTTIDGTNENAEFKCASVPAPVPVPISVPVSVERVNEQVKCVFANSDSLQKCYSEVSGCTGVGTCMADVSGERGRTLAWKSSCGGYVSTTLDGSNDYAQFQCAPAATAQPVAVAVPSQTGVAVEFIKEQVKCVFANSGYVQKCYTEDGRFGCSGQGTCVADVGGGRGARLAWKSSCGSYGYTVIDGNNEYAEFRCEPVQTATPVQVSAPVVVKEQVKCIFANSVSTQSCGSEGFQCSGVGTCVVDISGEKGKMLTWKSTCGGYAYTVVDGNNDYAEFSCQQATPLLQVPVQTVQACKDSDVSGACARNEVKEQVRCVFSDPELIQRCYADFGTLGCQDLKRDCYSEDGRFRCSDLTVASTPVENGGFKYVPFCVADVSGVQGTKLAWKSSCGGYGYTVFDGNNEDVEFSCVPSSNVTSEQISGKGFLRAYWQCYDGSEENSVEGVDMTSCRSSEIWQEYARERCKSRCYPDGSKCGVKSFSVSGECYIDVQKEGVFISSVGVETIKAGEINTEVEKREATEKKSAGPAGGEVKEVKEVKEAVLMCKDSCPLDGKCYPFGYRKGSKFCSDDGSFRGQLSADDGCDNNFECSTNVCMDGKCVSSGLIKKFVSWFQRLFS